MIGWTETFLPLSFILFLALCGAYLSKKLNKPTLLSFILLGVIVSNVVKTPLLTQQFLQPLATLGVVLLLFTVGLESPLYAIIRKGANVYKIAALQMAGTSLGIFVFIVVLFHNLFLALVLSVTLALSSTAIVGKMLNEQGEGTSRTGSTTLGILIIQDLVSVLVITVLTAFISNGGGSITTPIINSGISILVLGVVYFVSIVAMDKLFVLSHFNREELALFTFALLFFSLWLFTRLSIPETTAGFLVGAILAHRIEQHEIFSQVRVFRDILLVLFFFFLGTYITIITLPLLVFSFLFAVVIMLIKFTVLSGIIFFMGYHKKTAFWVSFDLMQVGEFSFVILSLLGTSAWLKPYEYQFFLMVVIWSLLIFSLLYQYKHRLYDLIDKKLLKFLPSPGMAVTEQENLKSVSPEAIDHIIICGYGRVGAYVGHGLLLSNIPVVVIDTNKETVHKLKEKGVKVLYGDATEPDLLSYAQAERAQFLIIALPDPIEQEKIILTAKHLNPKIRIITRSHLTSHMRHLKALGVEYLFQPEFEAAVTILKSLLKIYKRDKDEIKKHIHYLKIEHGMAS
ncbi:MAG: cation:proton antiporter [Patescibacteria group bacterium]|jgi:CPA2 family monovalent cation:H+ antiporter-2